VPDGRRLEEASRELVQQRLEGVVVVFVDDDDVDVRLLQRLRGADAREAASENEDAWLHAVDPPFVEVAPTDGVALGSPPRRALKT
jgi:hypothetical protein